MTREMAEQIVDDIINDIKGRRGIGDEFCQIDLETRDEIFEEWVDIVLSGSNI